MSIKSIFRSEADVKKAIKKILDDAGAWYFMPVSAGYGKHGIPDFVCCLYGRFLAIEAKHNGNMPTALQAKVLKDIAEHGGGVLVIDETNIYLLQKAIQDARSHPIRET